MTKLFQRDRSVIGKYIRIVLKEVEMNKGLGLPNLPILLMMKELSGGFL